MVGILQKKALVLIIIFCIFVYVYYTLVVKDGVEKEQWDIYEEAALFTSKNQKYLINTSTCRIPNINPFNEEVRKYVYKERYTKCTNLGLLTYIDKDDGLATLKINSTLLPEYSYFKIQCCYSEIYRFNYYHKSDNEVRYSPCVKFENKTILSYPFIKVQCSNFFRHIYSNVHATVIPKKTQKTARKRTYQLSVLVVGIDSISKLNLRRTMPKTTAYLEQHFHSLNGYNKIGDNTFPNLMAILTGQNDPQLDTNCPRKVKLNNCDMIWDTFRELGYVTAYAEDECSIGTFNFNRPGFRDPPTDYYYRPYMVAAEELGGTERHEMAYCAGPETSAERVFNIVGDFSISFKDVPSFGLFWMNSFSHDNINMPSAMDERVLEFLSDSSFRSSLEDTVMVFLSDHGFRFGDIRYTHTGWLEERLPFIYIYLPDSFKRNFREKYENFMVNTKRLTTPFDIYCTFQDLLEIGNSSYTAKKSQGCPNCQSLFKNLAENRTCKAVSIVQHWCTCTGHIHVSPKNHMVRQVALYVVKEINNFVERSGEGGHCSKYKLRNVVTAGMSEYYLNEKNQTVRYFLVIVETRPIAMFEATVEDHTTSKQTDFKLLGDISRINRYKDNSHCVENSALKKYCYCDGYLTRIRKAICSFINC